MAQLGLEPSRRIISRPENQPLTRLVPAFSELSELRPLVGVEALGSTFTDMANTLRHAVILGAAAFLGLFSNTNAKAVPPESPADHLAVTAWMDVADGNLNGVIVEVNVNGTQDWGRPDADGRVELLLPSNAVAMIHFRKPGHVTKVVSVDTHNMNDASFNGKRPHLSFGVAMEAEQPAEVMAAAPSMGSIAFDETGDLVIQQAQHLIRPRGQKVVF